MKQNVKNRTITVKLSDSDVSKICEKAGENGITVSELIENFIEDLIDGDNSNGSNERRVANEYLESCRYSVFPNNSLLARLLNNGYDPRKYLWRAKDLDELMESDSPYSRERIKGVKEEIDKMLCGWKSVKPGDIVDEREKIREWVDEYVEMTR